MKIENNSFSIKKRKIGLNQPTFFIADLAANHDGNFKRAKKLIYLAKKSGADAVKFQHFLAPKIVSDYGFRNLGDPEKGLHEFYRVLKPGGEVGILEFFQPKSTIMAKVFKFYFNKILPRIASLFSNSKAYRYLPESVENFVTPDELKILLERAHFHNISLKNMSFGITTIVNAEK